jgi:hypothetical protein
MAWQRSRLGAAVDQRLQNSPLLHNRWLRRGVQALIVVFCLVYLVANLRSIEAAQLELHLGLVLLSGLVTVVAVFLGALGWWLTLRTVGQQVRWSDAAHAHLFSTLAKYLPGYAWQLLGKAYRPAVRGTASVVAVGMTSTGAVGAGRGVGWRWLLCRCASSSAWLNDLLGRLAVAAQVALLLLCRPAMRLPGWLSTPPVGDVHMNLVHVGATLQSGWLVVV